MISVAAKMGAGVPSAAGIAVGRGEDAAWGVAVACGVAVGVGRSVGMALLASEGSDGTAGLHNMTGAKRVMLTGPQKLWPYTAVKSYRALGVSEDVEAVVTFGVGECIRRQTYSIPKENTYMETLIRPMCRPYQPCTLSVTNR